MDWFGIKARKAHREGEKAAEEKRIEDARAEHERDRQGEFCQIFGFEMQSPYNPRSWEQVLVDRVLQLKARLFSNACAEQERIMRQLKDDPSLDPRNGTIAKELEGASMVVEARKKEFWDSHHLAAGLRFSMRQTYEEYLTDPQAK